MIFHGLLACLGGLVLLIGGLGVLGFRCFVVCLLALLIWLFTCLVAYVGLLLVFEGCVMVGFVLAFWVAVFVYVGYFALLLFDCLVLRVASLVYCV